MAMSARGKEGDRRRLQDNSLRTHALVSGLASTCTGPNSHANVGEELYANDNVTNHSAKALCCQWQQQLELAVDRVASCIRIH
eukprot:m.873209 g.873209  ORF g.873209 m.873209 type:complete len:83 (-) comp59784_c1_seq13:423-671(-)